MSINKDTILSLIAFLTILFSLYILITFVPNFSRDNIDISKAPEEVLEIKRLIEEQYTGHKDFEKIDSFAGTSVKYRILNNNYYFAYIKHGSGLPIVAARCFKVDGIKNVTYKDLEKSDIMNSNIDITTCRLVPEDSDKSKGNIKYYKIFNFHNRSVILERMGSGQFSNTFWDREFEETKDIKTFNEKEIVDKLYEKGVSTYYIPYPVDTYFELFPGFYRKFSIKSYEEISKLYDDKYECKISSVQRYNKEILEQECIHRVVNEGKLEYSSRFTNCHLPLSDNTYLSYIQVGNILDGDYNLCLELDNIGLQDWQ